MNETIIRHQIADYLNLGTETEQWEFCGTGFSQLDEKPNAQVEQTAYINDKSKSSTVTGYETQFPFNTNLMKSEKAVMAIYDVARNQRTGGEAEMDYIRVEIFRSVTQQANTFSARKFRVSVEVSDIAGEGAEIIKVSGNFNNVGSFVDGTFNTATKKFTPAGEPDPEEPAT